MLIQKVSVKAVLTDACQSGRHMGVDFRLKFHHCTSPGRVPGYRRGLFQSVFLFSKKKKIVLFSLFRTRTAKKKKKKRERFLEGWKESV